MIFISHRGNLEGSRKDENKPQRILDVLNQDYYVEIDVWCIKGQFWLGHDEPAYKVSQNFLMQDVYCHAKNPEAIAAMLTINNVHCFWHQTDTMALTSSNILWVYPGKMVESIKSKSINVMPENHSSTSPNTLLMEIDGCFGVCSDYVGLIRQAYHAR